MIFPLTKISPLEVASTRVTEANTFRFGLFVGLGSGGWAAADNTDRELYAVGWVTAADPASFRVVSARGEVVEWPGHGLGSAGDRLWLGTAGGVLSSESGGAAVEVVQVVAKVWDADHIQLFPPEPVTF